MPGVSESEFIDAVRRSLGRDDAPPSPPYERMAETLPELETRWRKREAFLAANREALTTRLADVAAQRGWQVSRAANVEDAIGYVCRLAAERSATKIIRSLEPLFDRIPIDAALSAQGANLNVMSRQVAGDADTFAPDEADIGVTGADYAIAETGTVVLLPRAGVSRRVSLLPPIHVALVRPADALEGLHDIYLLRRISHRRDGAGSASYMNFITGPSRTADIEQTLVIGAHGPKEAHMVILDWETA